MAEYCSYRARWHLEGGRAVYEPCERCGRPFEAAIHDGGEEDPE